jgi:hypothetical protein
VVLRIIDVDLLDGEWLIGTMKNRGLHLYASSDAVAL